MRKLFNIPWLKVESSGGFDWGSEEILQSENIVNGGFDTSDDWYIFESLGEYFGNQITGGKLVIDKYNAPYQGDNNGYIEQELDRDLKQGSKCRLSFDVITEQYFAGEVYIEINDGSSGQTIYILTGNKNETITVDFIIEKEAQHFIKIFTYGSGSGFLYKIDNISLKEIFIDGLVDYWHGGVNPNLDLTGEVRSTILKNYNPYSYFYQKDSADQGLVLPSGFGYTGYTISWQHKAVNDSEKIVFYLDGSDVPIIKLAGNGTDVLDFGGNVILTNYIDNEFNHFVVRFNFSTIDIFLNGVKADTEFYSQFSSYIDFSGSGSATVKEISVFNGLLSDEQIGLLNNSGTPLIYPNTN